MRPYYIFSSGRISRKENTLQFENDKEKKSVPIEDVESIHIFGEVDLSTKLLNFLSQKGVPIHFYNYYGFYSGSFLPRSRNVSGSLLVKQVEHYLDESKRLFLAKSFVESASYHMLRNLKSYSSTVSFQDAIRADLENIWSSKKIDELMGCEGRIRNAYYEAFNNIFEGKNMFSLNKREKRPPKDPVNALISYGNSLIYSTVLTEIYSTQLNPTISYLHEPSEKRFSLSLDIAEIFKPLIVDPIIFKLINNNMLEKGDFDEDLNFCYLSDSGKKKFIKELDQKLNTTVKHRKLKRNVSYRQLIRIECYKLIKHLLGDELYTPLKAWW